MKSSVSFSSATVSAPVTRFAPSPTGYMHVGNARTALFNFLFARHYSGTFLLRIEDTDKERHTPEAVEVIFQTLQWMGIQWDGDVVFQSANQTRHQEVVQSLLEQGKAYYCYCTPQELDAMREQALKQGHSPRYTGLWRNKDPREAPAGIAPVVRLKMPLTGQTVLKDHIQGDVTVNHGELDDMVLLRSDGSPTYMCSVVVDDHDMGITQVIRGSDHLTNTFRQIQLFQALGWAIPEYAHIPLIHGSDGGKLSKRHGALSVEDYRTQGYLCEAVCNYLLKLGWSHGDHEIISREQALQWFSLDHVQKSPARFDPLKLTHLNGHYLREKDAVDVVSLVTPFLENQLKRPVTAEETALLTQGMGELKIRAKTLLDLAESSLFYLLPRPIPLEKEALKILDEASCALLRKFYPLLDMLDSWTLEGLEKEARTFSDKENIKLGALAQPLRAALTGRKISPGVFEVMATLGRDNTLGRLEDVLKGKGMLQECMDQ